MINKVEKRKIMQLSDKHKYFAHNRESIGWMQINGGFELC